MKFPFNKEEFKITEKPFNNQSTMKIREFQLCKITNKSVKRFWIRVSSENSWKDKLTSWEVTWWPNKRWKLSMINIIQINIVVKLKNLKIYVTLKN